MLDDGAHVRQFLLLVAAQVLRRELGVCDEDFVQAHVAAGAHEGEDFAPAEVARRENHVVLLDALEAAPGRFDQVA